MDQATTEVSSRVFSLSYHRSSRVVSAKIFRLDPTMLYIYSSCVLFVQVSGTSYLSVLSPVLDFDSWPFDEAIDREAVSTYFCCSPTIAIFNWCVQLHLADTTTGWIMGLVQHKALDSYFERQESIMLSASAHWLKFPVSWFPRIQLVPKNA